MAAVKNKRVRQAEIVTEEFAEAGLDVQQRRRSVVRTIGQRIPKTAELLAQEIASEILSEELSPGDRLPLEGEMIARYGVGRSTVREALRILEVNGLIVMRAGRHGGPLVGDAGPTNFGRMLSLFMYANGVTLGEIIKARAILEPSLLRQALEADEKKLAERAMYLKQRGRECDVNSVPAFRLVTREFHEFIASVSANRPLALLAMGLMYLTRLDHEVRTVDSRREVIDEHEKILDAILSGDKAGAEALMAEHMQHFVESVALRQPNDFNRIINWRWG